MKKPKRSDIIDCIKAVTTLLRAAAAIIYYFFR